MPRSKKYNEEEVLEKAMQVFWKQGFEATTMQVLEKEMGINKFSIYASFGSKTELLSACLANYKKQLNKLLATIVEGGNNIAAIKEYFYLFIVFSKENELGKGCFITNTANEFSGNPPKNIQNQLKNYTNDVRNVFKKALISQKYGSDEEIDELADFLLISMFGFSTATKIFSESQLHFYIKNLFSKIDNQNTVNKIK